MKRLVLVLISVITSLTLAEGILRVLDIQAIQPHKNEAFEFPCYTKGSWYWLSLKPSTTCTLRSTTAAFPPITVITNSLGLRSPDIPIPKPADTVRILVLGDSFTMGMGVSEEKTFPRLVESQISHKLSRQRIEIINAGLPTADMRYYYLFIKELGETLDPDIVVIGFYPFNDVHDEEILPFDKTIDQKGLPLTVDSTNAYVDYTGVIFSKRLPAFMKLPLLRSLQLANLVGYIVTHLPGIRSVTKLPLISPQFCLFNQSCHQFDGDNEKAKQLFLAIRGIAQGRNRTLLVTLIPAELQIYDAARYKFNIPTPLSPTQKQYLHGVWTEFFDANGIASLDLLPTFLGNTTPRTYFENDTHWNETGHKLAAESLTQKLIPYLAP